MVLTAPEGTRCPWCGTRVSPLTSCIVRFNCGIYHISCFELYIWKRRVVELAARQAPEVRNHFRDFKKPEVNP